MSKEIWLTETSKAVVLDNNINELMKDGHLDFAKINELAGTAQNIAIITGYGTGKSFGSIVYHVMEQKENIAIILNTKQQVDNQILPTLRSLQYQGRSEKQLAKLKPNEKAIMEYFTGWEIIGNEILDTFGKVRIKFYPLSSVDSIKGARDYFPDVVIYDEFNQGVKWVEQKGVRAMRKLDIILGRFKAEGISYNRVYYFANKNSPEVAINASKLLNDLGINSLSDLGEVNKIYRYFNRNIESNVNIEDEEVRFNTLLLNPYFSPEKQTSIIQELIDKSFYDKEARQTLNSLLITDTSGIFNTDTREFKALIINSYRLFLENNTNLSDNLLHQDYLATKDGDILQVFSWLTNQKGQPLIHVKTLNEDELKELGKIRVVVPKNVFKEDQFIMSRERRIAYMSYINYNKVSYEDVATRSLFLNLMI